MIRPTGFFRAKTNSVITLSAAIVERFGGEVPGRLEDLVTLPGVGRKTANVVLGNAFGVPGITVDTHVGRLSRRFGWTEETDPVKVEHAIGGSSPGGSGRCSATADLPRPAHLPRAQTGVRCLSGGELVPVIRRGRDRPGQGPRRSSRSSSLPARSCPTRRPGPLPDDPPASP